jgi:hypothetical protein
MKKAALGFFVLLSFAVAVSEPTAIEERIPSNDGLNNPISTPQREELGKILYSFGQIKNYPVVANLLINELAGRTLVPIVAVSMIDGVVSDYVNALKGFLSQEEFSEARTVLLSVKPALIRELFKDRPSYLKHLEKCKIIQSNQ